MSEGAKEPLSPNTQRIDRWLWYARFFKTRTLAAKFVTDGRIRITRNNDTFRADKPSFLVRSADTLVFTRNDHLRIIDVLAFAERRGPASEAKMLYEDQSPPRPPRKDRPRAPFTREKGAGRPTKKDRRALEILKTES